MREWQQTPTHDFPCTRKVRMCETVPLWGYTPPFPYNSALGTRRNGRALKIPGAWGSSICSVTTTEQPELRNPKAREPYGSLPRKARAN